MVNLINTFHIEFIEDLSCCQEKNILLGEIPKDLGHQWISPNDQRDGYRLNSSIQ